MIVSVTEIQQYKRCRRQWDFGSFNRRGLTPIIQPKPYLDLGGMVHKSLAYWTQHPDADLAHVFMAIAVQHKAHTVAKYVAATGSQPSAELLEPLLDAIVLGRSMMENYQTYHGSPLPAHMSFVAPEQEILVPIYGTDHLLKGRLDTLVQDAKGNLYIVEHKTYGNRPDLDSLEVNDQFIGYMWTAQQLQIGEIVGIAYDGMWKRAVPPQRPKKLTIADLFVRTIIRPSQTEIDEYGRELANTVPEMASQPPIYKNRRWEGCWDCGFDHLCRTVSRGEDAEHVIAREYTTRTEESTEQIEEVVNDYRY